MSRQYFMDTISADPPIVDQTAIVGTTETLLWAPTSAGGGNVAWPFPTGINANDARPGKMYKLTAGGVFTTNTTGALTITPRFGTVIANPTLGANAPATVPGTAMTAVPWYLELTLVVRTVGQGGATNSTIVGTGFFMGSGLGTVNLPSLAFAIGGTAAVFDSSIAQGVLIGWTLSVAGSVTPKFALLQSLN